ncbi:structure-specific recognition protein 1 [Cavenderia fasciculata]|uniref:FACT complex subunit SSRP1 n=1 Tax=Cavenderia fasciculata TaxID=261658 RepID=F4PX70_CACFS|nr:structure-specific recognition protein 1 [Cavenderia fasciculata]EGG19873.1 structure-specific recognition protein 1 [Cavenderia fasciculata]|eukprot:XP_004358220.1 structure-specific recognition protein 1 [Cavenderia fasciculata]
MSTANNGSTGAFSFNNISLGGRIGGTRGVLKMNNVGLAWKSEAGRSETIQSSEIEAAGWTRMTPKIYQLNLKMKGGASVKFDGFREPDNETLKQFFKENYDIELDNIELSTRGVNFSMVKVNGSIVSFTGSNQKTLFEFPISEISQSIINLSNKNELTMEFHHDSTLDEEDESLVEVRLYNPFSKSLKEDEDNTEDPVKDFQDALLRKSDISQVGKRIAVLENIQLVTPRGRCDVEMYPTFLRLHGKTHDYKVIYNTISKLFQLPKQDQANMYFVISLDPPVRQGKTKYDHLVIQLPKNQEASVELNLTDEAQEKYKDKLSPTMDGTFYVIVRRILTSLTGKNIIVPGNFQSANQFNSIKCSLKANEGDLYPLERSFFFIYKPPTYIKFTDIDFIEFSRAPTSVTGRNAPSSRNFDLGITLKNQTNIQFTNILKEEYENLHNFIQSKGIKVAKQEQAAPMRMLVDEDDSDDDDYEPDEDEESSDDDDAAESSSESSSEEEKKTKKKQKKN